MAYVSKEFYAILKRFKDEGRIQSYAEFVRWAVTEKIHREEEYQRIREEMMKNVG